MIAIPHIVSPISAPWLPWLLLVLALCVGYCYFRQPQWMLGMGRNILSKHERTYGESTMDYVVLLLLSIYCIGISGLTTYLLLYQSGTFQFVVLLKIIGLMMGISLIKGALIGFVDWTFELYRKVAFNAQQYFQICLLLNLLLFPIVLLMMNIGSSTVMMILVLSLLCLALILMVIKIIRTTTFRPLTIIYILLYVVVLEILPLAVFGYMATYII